MNNREFNAGVFVILNEKNKRCFYVGAEDLMQEIQHHMNILEAGNHENQELQGDYSQQKGNGFHFIVISEKANLNTVSQVMTMLLDIDLNSYNNK